MCDEATSTNKLQSAYSSVRPLKHFAQEPRVQLINPSCVQNVIEKHKNLPTTRQPLWDIDLRRRIVSSLASLNSTGGGSSSSSRLERHAGV